MIFKGRGFFRKFKKNKLLVLIVCIIVICAIYFGVEKAIDSYAFKFNNDIVSDGGSAEVEDVGDFDDESEADKTDDSWFDWLFGDDDLGPEANLEVDGDGENLDDGEEADVDGEKGELNGYDGEGSDGKEGDLPDSVDRNDVDADEDIGTGTEVAEHVEKIYVYITGEVNSPGVVVLNEGCRIVDAINAAGGTTVKANVSKVNLVYVLEDGMKVNIPNSNDLKNNPNFEYITMSSGDGANDSVGLGGSGSDSLASSSSSSNIFSVVNINKATQTELECLPGIGPSLALKIINYRKENGYFSSVEELKNVSGIGDKKFEELKNYITV